MKHKLLVFLSLFTFQLYAEVAVFQHYGINQGLDNINIRSIAEDNNGFMWIGTETALYSFDGSSFMRHDSSHISNELSIQHLYVLENNDVLIGTRHHGLLLFHNNRLTQIDHHELHQQSINGITRGPEDQVWFATNNGLFQFSKSDTVEKISNKVFGLSDKKKINAITRVDDRQLVFSQGNALTVYDIVNETIHKIELNADVRIHDVYKDRTNVLWIGTSQRLFRYDLTAKKILFAPELRQASRILSIKAHQDHVWIASIDGGLFGINIHTLKPQQYTHDKSINYSLSDKNIMALFISRDGTLWAGGFYNGLNALNLNHLNFNFQSNQKNSIHCATNPRIFSIKTDHDQSLWLGSSDGLIHWQPKNNSCQLINHNNAQQSTAFSVYDTSVNRQNLWIASSIGLLFYDINSQHIKAHNSGLPQTPVFFVLPLKNNHLLLGTSQGLYRYNTLQSTYHKVVVPEEKFARISFTKYFVDENEQVLLPTKHGLLFLNTDNQLQTFNAYDNFFSDKIIEAVTSNDQGELFISVNGHGLYHLNTDHDLVDHYFDEIKQHNIKQILISDNVLWMSSDKGLISLDSKSQHTQFYSSEAHENYLALSKSSHQNKSGTLYFGGNSGLIHFDPTTINNNVHVYPLILSTLYLMDTPVALNNTTETGFKLSTPINHAESLTFSHKDTMIGLSFIQPNYHTPKATQYRYRLSPISSKWSSLKDRDRQLTFTNLKSGRYQLDIEAISPNGTDLKSIELIIKSPPWFSWWALGIYLLLILLAIYVYINRKTANQQKLNAYLKKQVTDKTKHLAQQKQLVEDLMTRKNEIFSNVSHEFRTPITLILGPMEELLKTESDQSKKHRFNMVTRNAKRLLDLVNQMLKLAQINEVDTSEKQLIELSSRLNMIIEPFIHLAKLNQIDLVIHPFDNITLKLTEDALETIMANLLSNAIKYTDVGGKVDIGTRLSTHSVEIFVKDNGTGIAHADQHKIFKRFERLHQDSAQGTGIGLALVKELVEINKAELTLNSESGAGTEFIITFAVDSSLQNENINHQPIALDNTSHIDPSILSNKQTVLIIDDNQDMRLYIQQILELHFNCIVAVGGADGITKALKHVPDIVVCDVMMPTIDGFQVCRQLRSEIITSHIPLVLLTAVNEKASRIKGWRENIDRYLNKPFDAQELILQLKNILNTRQLMIAKHHMPSSATEQPYFSEMDQAFIDKLKDIIHQEYSDPLFNVEKMARLMTVSDRQLQRKIKALLDRSPLDVLRQTRLTNAAQMLAKGKQIAYTSDMCGFSNASHFSYSFKKSYGMTPKAYQKLKHVS